MAECVKGVYRLRRLRETAFYRLVDQHYERFEPERYEDRYGYLRPVIARRSTSISAVAT